MRKAWFFSGDQVADFLAVDGAVTNGLQAWEIKLHRRVIGQYLLQVNYQTHIADQSGETILRGVLAADVNLQRGFATVQSAGRLQVRVDNLPASLQPTEWQGIPRALQKDLPTVAASFAYRLVEPDFQLPLKLERHEAAKLLPARVNNITFTSVISDAGVMLTQARLEILPGDKRLLHLTLPAGANFWFAFVNQNGVWPWREADQILIPLEQQSRGDQPVPVEIFFSSEVGKAGGGALDLNLLAPKFDLPLENLTWRVFLNDKWQVKKWSGALQLQQSEIVANGGALDLQSYLQNESSLQQQKTQQAEQMLALGKFRAAKRRPAAGAARVRVRLWLVRARRGVQRGRARAAQQSEAAAGAGGFERAAGRRGRRASGGSRRQAQRVAEQQGRELHAAGREADH